MIRFLFFIKQDSQQMLYTRWVTIPVLDTTLRGDKYIDTRS